MMIQGILYALEAIAKAVRAYSLIIITLICNTKQIFFFG